MRPEFASQSLQRRCFVACSYKQKRLGEACVEALRDLGLATWSYFSFEFGFDESTWEGMSLREALENEEVKQAAKADKTFLETLTPADFFVLLLPSGFSSGWETGFATARGAHVVVVGENPRPDIPLTHAHAFFTTWQEAVFYIAGKIQRATDASSQAG